VAVEREGTAVVEALEREIGAAGKDAAQMAGIDAAFFAKAIARAVALLDKIGKVVAVVGWGDFALCDAQARLRILADPVGHGICRQIRATKLLRRSGRECRPFWCLTVLGLDSSQEREFFLGKAAKLFG
jgi:hypothetical protein